MGGVVVSIVVFVLVALILVCVALIIANLVQPKLPWEDMPPCDPVEFCTKKEQSFYNDLTGIAQQNDLLIFSKVGLGCVLKPRRGVRNRDLWSKKLRGEYADFIVCDPRTLKTLVVVVLDESALALQKTQMTAVDKSCELAGVPLLHVREYNLPGLEKALMQKIGGRRPGRSAAPQPADADLTAS